MSVFAVCVLLVARPGSAQGNGRISGTVRDSHGARISQASVTVLNEQTGQQSTTTSNDQGFFEVASLPPATYTIRVARDGFELLEYKNRTLAANQDLPLDVELKVSGAIERVNAAVTSPVGQAPGQVGVAPAAGYVPPDDTPAIRIGAVIYPEYVFTQTPEATDADGNKVSSSAFNVTRAYINVTGNISHLVAFRITPDITRESFAGPSVSGSLVFRLKYAYAQINLDDWMSRGSWLRFGIQQTPIVDFEEGIYRYRFQGTVFSERDGFLTSSDAGVSFHYNVPQNYGDVHVGYYNGDGYSKIEANDQKAFQIRGTLRPLPMSGVLKGLRITGFYDNDYYIKDGDRKRGIVMLTFEHKYVNAGFDYLNASDQTSISKADAKAEGYSVWATPKTAMGLEGLLRYDHVKPNKSVDAERSRAIVGIAYWFPHQGNVSTAFLLDYEHTTSDRFNPAVAKVERIGVHGLVSF